MGTNKVKGTSFTKFSNYSLATLALSLVLSGVGFSQVIYDNGRFQTGSISRNGTAAPAGKQWSEVQNDNGNTTETNTLAASGCQAVPGGNNRCADNFVIPVGQTWTVSGVTVYIIQVGATTNPVTNMNLRIWNGRPEAPGSVLVFGDTTTNRFVSSTDTNTLRCFNSAVPTSNVPRTDLTIWEVKMSVFPASALPAGTYWVDYQTTTTAAQFSPLVTYVGARNTPLNDARQFTSSTGLWADVVDAGNPATAADVRLDIPFKLEGSRAGVPAILLSRTMDFDGDNSSDFAIARSASAATGTEWWVRRSGGGVSTTFSGTGVGFPTGDKAAPADFDGDGKTDVAVWRPAAAGVAGFHIVQSSDNTIRFEQFGQTGDDSSLVGDYDGDGRADPAVFRGGSQATFFYRGSLNNPSGNTTFIPWGTTGDTALAGDFDGDGRRDFAVVRDSGGLAVHWRRMANGAVQTFQYGLITDKFVTADYDHDYRADTAAVRTSGASFVWYLLKSSDSTVVAELFGAPATDFPITGDYDGDGQNDIAVWRSGAGADGGNFFVRNSGSARSQSKWGTSGANLSGPDYPVANFTVK